MHKPSQIGWMLLLGCFCGASVSGADDPAEQDLDLDCQAHGTVGFHDYPGEPKVYEPSVFFESRFQLQTNRLLMEHLPPNAELAAYLTLSIDDERHELECRRVRGMANARGLSCTNQPPSAMFLLNLDSLRFSRGAMGGWALSQSRGAKQRAPGDYRRWRIDIRRIWCL